MTTLLIVTTLSVVLAGQAPPAAAAPAAPAAAAPSPAPVEAFIYNPEGRRDPFVSLLRGGTDSRGVRRTPGVEGVAGLSVNEISVRGVVASKSGYVAMVTGPDSKTYLVRANDKLLDGTVKSVTAQGLVILQEVNDPLSLVKQKEIRKMLRGLEEGK
jgi:type IV pilus assembly protein PilP